MTELAAVPATQTQRMERYADLVVRLGANVQPGQDVQLTADVEQLDLARVIVERAYAAGARRVETRFIDDQLRRSAIVHGAEDGLRSAYGYELAMVEEARVRGDAWIWVTSPSDSATFDGLDPKLVTAKRQEAELARGNVVARPAHRARRAIANGETGLASTEGAHPCRACQCLLRSRARSSSRQPLPWSFRCCRLPRPRSSGQP